MPKGDPPPTYYQPPGSAEWRRVNDRPSDRGAPSARERARRLLDEADVVARNVQIEKSPSSPSKSEVEELELEMSAALGSFDRFVTAGAKKLMHTAEEFLKRRK